jgi:hypothetical protein
MSEFTFVTDDFTWVMGEREMDFLCFSWIENVPVIQYLKPPKQYMSATKKDEEKLIYQDLNLI